MLLADRSVETSNGKLSDQLTTDAGEKSGKGWLLEIQGAKYVAVGERELIHILPEPPALRRVPRAPRHACHVMVWQERILPVIDVAVLCNEAGVFEPLTKSMVGVVAFRSTGGGKAKAGDRKSIGMGALLLQSVPRRLETEETRPCDLPEHLQPLAKWSLSCLDHPEYGALPILNLSMLFSVTQGLAMDSV